MLGVGLGHVLVGLGHSIQDPLHVLAEVIQLLESDVSGHLNIKLLGQFEVQHRGRGLLGRFPLDVLQQL